MATGRLRELQEIESAVMRNERYVDHDVRKRFWKLVREIKCAPRPDDDEIESAARIRNILFVRDRGKSYPLIPFLVLWFLIGSLVFIPAYWRMLQLPLDWANLLTWTASEWQIFEWRLSYLAAATFFYYPFGRLAGGLLMGIKLEGVCRGKYYEPTLKIDYVTFLQAPAKKRKWLFLFAGMSTVVALTVIGLMGFIVAGDLTGLIAGATMLIVEGCVTVSGTTKYVGGEMAHFNRERAIERIVRSLAEPHHTRETQSI